MKFSSLLSQTGKLWIVFLDIVYPACCLACENSVTGQNLFCPQCWRQIRFIEEPFCQRLGMPFVTDHGDESVSPLALQEPPDFEQARSAVLYEGLARDLVRQLKYHDRHDLVQGMAQLCIRAGRSLLAEADILTPVPMHPLRLWKRRFNQAMLLTHSIADLTNLPCDPFLLKRVKKSLPQYHYTREQRRENMRGAFQIFSDQIPDKIRDKRILLIDDVITSGATANAAARILLRHGARAVDVLTFARTPSSAM